MKNLFAYGTLMHSDIMEMVSGLPLSVLQDRAPASLHGFTRHAFTAELYPAVIPSDHVDGAVGDTAGDTAGNPSTTGLSGKPVVEGVVYRGITPESWNRLDLFEGQMYERREVSVTVTDASPHQRATQTAYTLRAGVYVLKPQFAHLLANHDWDAAAFQRTGKSQFLRTYCGFSAVE